MWQTLNAANIEVEGIRTSRTSGVKSRWVDTRPVIRCGFTLIEMLTTVAILVIVFGLLVNLAHHVRERSAVALTQNLVRQLDGMMSAYVARHGQPPAVPPFPPGDGNWTHVEGPSAAIPGSHLRAGGRTMQVEAEPEELVVLRPRTAAISSAPSAANQAWRPVRFRSCPRRSTTTSPYSMPGEARSSSCRRCTPRSGPPQMTASFSSPRALTGVISPLTITSTAMRT